MPEEKLEPVAALRCLIIEARRHDDVISWATGLLRQSDLPPHDKHYLLEGLAAAGRVASAEVLQADALPRCSFCLKTNADVLAMVSAPNANICNECSDIVRAQFRRNWNFNHVVARLRVTWKKLSHRKEA